MSCMSYDNTSDVLPKSVVYSACLLESIGKEIDELDEAITECLFLLEGVAPACGLGKVYSVPPGQLGGNLEQARCKWTITDCIGCMTVQP